jgi:hypothetical protein
MNDPGLTEIGILDGVQINYSHPALLIIEPSVSWIVPYRLPWESRSVWTSISRELMKEARN